MVSIYDYTRLKFTEINMINQKNIIKLLFACCILIAGCANESKEIKTVTLEREISLNQLSDSTYITYVMGMVESNNKLYLTDYKRDQILILDKDLKLINTLGSAGKGPGEFVGASHITIFQDTLFIFNEGKNSIEVFDESKHLNTISPEIHSYSLVRFVRNRNGLYLSSVSKENSIIRFSSEGEIKNFGLLKQYNTEKETRIKNCKHILNYKENIIAVSNNRLNIEMYNSEGIILNEFNFDNIAIMKDRVDLINKHKSSNSSYILVRDAYIFNNKLYLLLVTNKGTKVESNKILEIDINNYEITRILNLGEGWFSSFCVTKNYIIAYDSHNATVVKFSLN